MFLTYVKHKSTMLWILHQFLHLDSDRNIVQLRRRGMCHKRSLCNRIIPIHLFHQNILNQWLVSITLIQYLCRPLQIFIIATTATCSNAHLLYILQIDSSKTSLYFLGDVFVWIFVGICVVLSFYSWNRERKRVSQMEGMMSLAIVMMRVVEGVFFRSQKDLRISSIDSKE